MADSPLRRAHQEWIGNVRPEGLLVSLPALELAQAAVDRNPTVVHRALLDLLPHVRVAQLREVRLMIETRRLYNFGIGLTDAHLIASVLIHPPTLLWTRDKRLRKLVEALGIHASLA